MNSVVVICVKCKQTVEIVKGSGVCECGFRYDVKATAPKPEPPDHTKKPAQGYNFGIKDMLVNGAAIIAALFLAYLCSLLFF